MARDWQISGESMVYVKSNPSSAISSLTELGLPFDEIRVTPDFRHRDIVLDAWGGEVPAEVQAMLAALDVRINLIHFDRAVLDECLRLSMGGPSAIGQVARAGARMGNNVGRFVSPNNFIGLNIASPIGNKPWRFFSAYMTGPPAEFPLGTEKSIVTTNWRVIPYTTDPWQGGVGATNYPLWDHTLDT